MIPAILPMILLFFPPTYFPSFLALTYFHPILPTNLLSSYYSHLLTFLLFFHLLAFLLFFPPTYFPLIIPILSSYSSHLLTFLLLFPPIYFHPILPTCLLASCSSHLLFVFNIFIKNVCCVFFFLHKSFM